MHGAFCSFLQRQFACLCSGLNNKTWLSVDRVFHFNEHTILSANKPYTGRTYRSLKRALSTPLLLRTLSAVFVPGSLKFLKPAWSDAQHCRPLPATLKAVICKGPCHAENNKKTSRAGLFNQTRDDCSIQRYLFCGQAVLEQQHTVSIAHQRPTVGYHQYRAIPFEVHQRGTHILL